MTTITTLPTPPSTSDTANFDSRADSFLGALPTLTTEINTIVGELNTIANTTVPDLLADTVIAKDLAEAASVTALSAANYLGTWASLGTSGVTRPASVSHGGNYWQLVPASIANASLSQPGVTADWLQIYSGALPLQYYIQGLI